MTDTKLDLYLTPRDAWDAMYKDCAQAKEAIDFEQYILKDDSAGLRFLELFRDKARAGVKVRLILDRVGSRIIYASKIVGDIIEAGGRVHFYNKLGLQNLLAPRTWFPRNHSKLMLVDNKTAYVGSVCVSEEMANWRDLHARVEGPLTFDIQNYFDHLWEHRVRHWRKAYSKKLRRNVESQNEFVFVAAPHRLRSNFLYKEILRQIKTAKTSICLVTPYFLPPFLLRHALFHAAARGVEITIMMSAKSDIPVADYVAQSYFGKFSKLGLQILLYKGTVIHAKYAIIDDNWATLGSTNMDYLSLTRNREANLIVRDQASIGRLKSQFLQDSTNCVKVDRDYCKNRPILNRILGWLFRPVRHFL